jgi:tRNA threonylcarbamoyladenosine biosynthesis protein TsaE
LIPVGKVGTILASSQSSISVLSLTPRRTISIGYRIGKLAGPGDVVLLNGELGAGKTTLTQGVARGLGIKEPARSPTFTLIRELSGRIPLYHVDLYRLGNMDEIKDLGLDEYFYGQGITVVEWAEKAKKLLPPENLSIKIDMKNESTRVFRLTGHYARTESWREK